MSTTVCSVPNCMTSIRKILVSIFYAFVHLWLCSETFCKPFQTVLHFLKLQPMYYYPYVIIFKILLDLNDSSSERTWNVYTVYFFSRLQQHSLRRHRYFFDCSNYGYKQNARKSNLLKLYALVAP